MFYAHFVLAKKGPLARIWLAAHWDKKLTKAHVFETNIEKSVDGILQPKVKMALRTSGHLLLGVVRIYSRKAKYLLADCNEAFVKIKMAFRPGMVDLPEDNREANVNAITLPEVFHDFDTAMPELNDVDIQAQFSLNQSRAEEITMREDYGTLGLSTTGTGGPASEGLGVEEDGFGDMLGFDRGEGPADLLREASSGQEQGNLLFSDHSVPEPVGAEPKEPPAPFPRPSTSAVAGPSSAPQPMDIDIPIRDDGFGGHLGQDIIGGGLFEGGLFDDAPLGGPDLPPEGSSVQEEAARAAAAAAALVCVAGTSGSKDMTASVATHSDESDDDGMDHYGGPPSPMGGHSDDDNSRPGSGLLSDHGLDQAAAVAAGLDLPSTSDANMEVPELGALDLPPGLGEAERATDQTTLLHNEEESFALAPVDAATLKGLTKAKRKRKLIVDEVKNISGEEMKSQLSDTSDIVTTLDLAPPTKRLMHWKETGGVEKLFALPGRPIPARLLFKCYLRHLTSKSSENEDFGTFGDLDREMLLEQVRGGPAGPADIVQPPTDLTGSTLMPDDQGLLLPPQTPAQLAQKQKPGRKRKAHELEEGNQMELETPQAPMLPPMTPSGDLSALQLSEASLATPAQLAMPPHLPPTPADLLPPAEQALHDATSLLLGEQPVVPPPPQPEIEQPIPEMVEQPVMPLPEPVPVPPAPQQPQVMPPMENLGYDQQMANMGYDEQLAPAVTPGHAGQGGPHTPWHEDEHEFPGSVGQAEEQQVDETYEQFEERVLNKRAAHMYHIVRSKLEKATDKSIFFSEMTHRNTRKQVAQKFYTLLVLKKYEAVELHQEKSYDDISITPGPKFENTTL